MNKKIWIFHHYATPPSMSGLVRPYDFAKQLNEYGFGTSVFVSSYLHYSNENVIQNNNISMKHEENNVIFIFVRTSSYKSNGISRVKNMVSFFKNLFPSTKKYAKNHGAPDLIIASSPHLFTLIAGIFIARRYKIPCICEIRDLWPEAIFTVSGRRQKSLLGRILIKCEHWIYKRADAIIFTKEGDVDYIKEHKWDALQGGDIDLAKCFYINNGVDIEAFDIAAEKEWLDDEDLVDESKFNVVYTGAIRLVNNVENIVETAVLLKEYKDIKFLIYGEGTDLEKIKKRVEDEHIENVRIKGYVNKKYIPYILSKSSLNLLNYSADKYNWTRGNSSNKLFEYMASGKPVISNVKMGYCIIDKYKCGISLEKSTPEALAEAILYVKNMDSDEYNKVCENARNGAKNFDFKILTEKLISVIESVQYI